MAQPVEYEQVGYNATTGVQVGNSTNVKIGFYGTAPIAQPTVTANHAVTSLVSTAGTYGFATSTAGMILVNAVSSAVQALKNLGITA